MTLAEQDSPALSYEHNKPRGRMLDRYEVEVDTGEWSLNIVLTPLLMYGETYNRRLAYTDTGCWEAKWMANDGQHGTCHGDDRDDAIQECIADYRGRRLKWLGPQGRKH